MKKLAAALTIAAISASGFGSSAQSLVFSTGTEPGVAITTSPFGTNVGVNAGLLQIAYSSNGFFDSFGHFHKVGHRHSHHQRHCKACEKEYRKLLKEAQKHHKKAQHHKNSSHKHHTVKSHHKH